MTASVLDATALCRPALHSVVEGRNGSCARAGPRQAAGRAAISSLAVPRPSVPVAAARGGSVLARASAQNGKSPVVFMWDSAQRDGLAWGEWRFSGGGGKYSGNGGGGGDSGGGSGYGDGGYYHRWFGTAAALFFLGAKSLVCWCSEDAKGVATVMDLGYLLTMALLSFVALSATPLALLQPVRARLHTARRGDTNKNEADVHLTRDSRAPPDIADCRRCSSATSDHVGVYPRAHHPGNGVLQRAAAEDRPESELHDGARHVAAPYRRGSWGCVEFFEWRPLAALSTLCTKSADVFPVFTCAGVHLLAIGPGSAAAGIYYWIGTQLIVTEITTFLPIAFHQVPGAVPDLSHRARLPTAPERAPFPDVAMPPCNHLHSLTCSTPAAAAGSRRRSSRSGSRGCARLFSVRARVLSCPQRVTPF